MKVCPSCNASIAQQTVSCPKCGHDFDEGRASKKTMMGFPSLGSQESEEEVESGEGFRFPVSSGQDAGGACDEEESALKTEVVSPDELPFDFDAVDIGDDGGQEEKGATRQVDPSSVFDALRGDEDEAQSSAKATAFGLPSLSDDEKSDDAASAWGLGAESDSEEDGAATKVVDPDTLSGIKLGEESSGGQDQRFGTLMGMSLEEELGDKAGAGAMQMGAGGDDDDEEEHSATAALSPDQLAKLDEMGFGDDSDYWEEDETGEDLQTAVGGRLKPGGGNQESSDDDLKTAVLDSSTAPKGFQLPKPASGSSPQKPTPDREKKETKKTPSAAPQSGVFRSVNRGKKKEDAERKAKGGRSARKDSGVIGTGTYQMSNTDAASGQQKLDDEKLKLGAVGGARTSFPTGKEEDDGPKEREPAVVSAPDGEEASGAPPAETVTPQESKPSTGPRFSIGQGGGDDFGAEQSTPEVENRSPFVDAAPELVDIDVEEEVAPAAKEDFQAPVEDLSVDPVESEPASVAPEPKELANTTGSAHGSPSPSPDSFDAPASRDFGDSVGAKPQPDGESQVSPSQDFGAQPASPANPPASQLGQGNFGAQQAPQPDQPHRAAPGAAGNFGAQQAPQQLQHSRPSPDAAAPQGAAPPREEAPQKSEATDKGASPDLERLISLAQMGTGLLSGAVLVLVAVVGLVIGGMPEGLVKMVVLFAPLVFGLGALIISPLPMAKKLKSAVFALVGMTALLGFLASLAVEMGMVLAIGQFAGAIFLFFAAGFPLLGKLASQ